MFKVACFNESTPYSVMAAISPDSGETEGPAQTSVTSFLLLLLPHLFQEFSGPHPSEFQPRPGS